MSVQPILVVILLSSIVSIAMGDKPEISQTPKEHYTNTTNTNNTTNTTPPAPAPGPGPVLNEPAAPLTSCQNLTEFKETVKLSSKDLRNSLETCLATKERMNVTGEGQVLLTLYDNLKNNKYLENPRTIFSSAGIVNKISECVSKRGKNFTSDEARKHLGFNDTLSLKFERRNCLDTMSLHQCVEDAYVGEVNNADVKNHKNAFMSSFEMLSANFCGKALIREDRGSGENYPPSLILIAATALMLIKL